MNWLVFGYLSFLGLLTPCLSETFHFIQCNKTWENATHYCRDHYTDLVTISDNETVTKLRESKHQKKAFWIGLYRTWQWSLDKRPFISNERYMNWNDGEPNLKNENCTTISETGFWYNQGCGKRFHFVCYNESQQPKYNLIEEKKTWMEAQKICRHNHTDLVSIGNSSENKQIKDRLNNTSTDEAWIGLFIDEEWTWSDETDLSFNYWNGTKPPTPVNETCVLADFQNNGKWIAKACKEEHPFVCYDDQLFLVNTENSTWEEALDYCRKESSDLVTVSSSRLQHWVSRQASNAITGRVWLGLKYTCVLEFWFWVNGENLDYENWEKHSEYDCGEAGALDTQTKKWVNLQVTERLNFICEKL